ncbi:alpha/beta hydrolase [Acidovorax sp. SUPP2539]|uniref:alpha/beta hydrolase n=1 Tax=Acidovorax sp. SUPP2539 TaxID=2920878 RepID=UPI0023DE63B1|nr:alpha/beta hydrolase [Acidovorax sp. SUPP2539]GKS88290.1 alpha/beta hydrolase [Acidovorax sp. SUPP2539]
MPLHPDLEAFLELANEPSSGRPKMHQMTAEQARAAYDRSTLALDQPGNELPIEMLELQTRDGSKLPARLYRGCAADSPAPTLLFFHGGGYVLGGLGSHDSLCRDLAHGTPCNVIAVDYRLAPEHRFPTAFFDAQDALAWLRVHGPEHGLDARKLTIGGDSVGGTLATALCIAERNAQRPQPILQMLLYPCTAARQDSASHERLASGYLLERETLDWMFGQYLRSDTDRRDWRFAPLEAEDLDRLAPVHLVLAEYDPLMDEGKLYAERLEAAGVGVSLHIYNGMVHDFARLGCITEEADTLRHDLCQALAQAFR